MSNDASNAFIPTLADAINALPLRHRIDLINRIDTDTLFYFLPHLSVESLEEELLDLIARQVGDGEVERLLSANRPDDVIITELVIITAGEYDALLQDVKATSNEAFDPMGYVYGSSAYDVVYNALCRLAPRVRDRLFPVKEGSS